MSIDDPGWGGDSFGGGTGGGDGWGDPGKTPSGRPKWLGTPYLAGAGVAVVVIVAVVLVLVLKGGGGGKATPVAVSTPKTVSSSTAVTSSSATPTPTPTKTVQTIATYDTQADAVCTAWKSRVTTATNSVSTPDQLKTVALPVLEGEVADLKKIPAPSTEAAQQKLWLTQIDTVLGDLSAENAAAVNPAITVADTTAGNLGMKVCNYGY